MIRFFKYFKIPFILLAILAVITVIANAASGPDAEIVRANTQTDLKRNVFNYAGNLEDAQVAALEEQIASMEDTIGCDIAIITLNETLSDAGYRSTPDKWVMEFADDFADEHMMGYDAPYGNSIVFIDNLYREEVTGKVYSWISTSGLAMEKLSQSDCESIMDDALYYLDDYSNAEDYYKAYARVIELLPKYFGSKAETIARKIFDPLYIVLFSLLFALFYILINWTTSAGVKTTVSTQYVNGGHPNVRVKKDTFIRKSVTKTKIETSSGGSGGHTSSGGHSHGGGGHSR